MKERNVLRTLSRQHRIVELVDRHGDVTYCIEDRMFVFFGPWSEMISSVDGPCGGTWSSKCLTLEELAELTEAWTGHDISDLVAELEETD